MSTNSNTQRQFPFLVFFILFTVFAALSWYVYLHPFIPFDAQVSHFVQKIHTPALDKVMLMISIFGELPYSLVSVLFVAYLFFRAKYKREALYIAQFVFSGLVILLIKNLVNRPRPTEFYVRLVEINRFQSYPSGHVLSYTLFFGFLILLMKRLVDLPLKLRKTVTFTAHFLIATIPFSRIYLGAHWFTDVVGGIFLGILYLIVVDYFYLKKKRGGNIRPLPAI